MSQKVLLVIPPFTQLNTPYPATAYLKGFLESKGIAVAQADLSIELFAAIFNKQFLSEAFEEAAQHQEVEFESVCQNKESYINRVDDIITFLQSPNLVAAQQLSKLSYYPKGYRITNVNTAIRLIS